MSQGPKRTIEQVIEVESNTEVCDECRKEEPRESEGYFQSSAPRSWYVVLTPPGRQWIAKNLGFKANLPSFCSPRCAANWILKSERPDPPVSGA